MGRILTAAVLVGAGSIAARGALHADELNAAAAEPYFPGLGLE